MREVYEFRIWEEYASVLFRPDQFVTSGLSRKALIPTGDPKLVEIARLQERVAAQQGKGIFASWDIRRRYSASELDESPWFKLRIRKTFEPAGEECGTLYDETAACSLCRSGARQITPLILPQRHLPKTSDLSETIAGEIVVSRRLVEAFRQHGVTGAEFKPIRHRHNAEIAAEDWFQMLAPAHHLQVTAPTRTGIKPFDEDAKGEYRCARGDLIGLNLLTEVSFVRGSAADLDVQSSAQYIGLRSGLLRPQRIIILSQRARRVLRAEGLKGAELEIAHAV